jgi:hypothetical protein
MTDEALVAEARACILEKREISWDLGRRLCEGPWHPARDEAALNAFSLMLFGPPPAGHQHRPGGSRKADRRSVGEEMNLPHLKDVLAMLERVCSSCGPDVITLHDLARSLRGHVERIEELDAHEADEG